METLKLTKQDIIDLLERKTETKNLDYKEKFRWDKKESVPYLVESG